MGPWAMYTCSRVCGKEEWVGIVIYYYKSLAKSPTLRGRTYQYWGPHCSPGKGGACCMRRLVTDVKRILEYVL